MKKVEKKKKNNREKMDGQHLLKIKDELSPEELNAVSGGLSTDPTEDEPFLPGC